MEPDKLSLEPWHLNLVMESPDGLEVFFIFFFSFSVG